MISTYLIKLHKSINKYEITKPKKYPQKEENIKLLILQLIKFTHPIATLAYRTTEISLFCVPNMGAKPLKDDFRQAA